MDNRHDPVNHPTHYTSHPSGVECITITRHMGFNLGNALKYIWRADLKNGLEDLEKAAWYIKDEITKRTNQEQQSEKEESCNTLKITLEELRNKSGEIHRQRMENLVIAFMAATGLRPEDCAIATKTGRDGTQYSWIDKKDCQQKV